jgi:DNA-binding NarL/FixJ family response regulator
MTSVDPIRLLVVDDHAAVRRGLRLVFELMDDIVVAAEADGGEQALLALSQSRFDVALVDLSMPDMSGIELIGRIRERGLQLPIVVFSMHSEAQVAQQAFAAGAHGYLLKGCDGERVAEAIRAAARHGPGPAAVELDAWPPAGADASRGLLSVFGQRVAALLDAGHPPEAIARVLNVRQATVSSYVARIRALRAESVSALAADANNKRSRQGGET